VSVRFRISRDAEPKFRWRTKSKAIPYGLWRLSDSDKEVVIVEGESDAHTLWYQGFAAIGLPGASTWKEDFASAFDNVEKIFLCVEPDKGGETLRADLTKSSLQDRIFLVYCDGWKDPSELYIKDRENFPQIFKEQLEKAVPWIEIRRQQEEAKTSEAYTLCKHLAEEQSILRLFEEKLPEVGVVGEGKLCKIIYLALTARLLDKILSLAIKGPSASGKSYILESVCKFFPESAYYSLTSMSEHALAYSEENLSHRFLIIYEASGLSSDLATYLIRSLLSEGRIRYETVIKTSEGIQPLLIERAGPTGLILTTTSVKLHPENETRMMTLTVSDTQDQTREIFRRLAQQYEDGTDLINWVNLQVWLESGKSWGRHSLR
jgi:hypothetical protein